MTTVKVTTVDGMDTKFTIPATIEETLTELEKPEPTFIIADDKDTGWFVKTNIIRVVMRESQ